MRLILSFAKRGIFIDPLEYQRINKIAVNPKFAENLMEDERFLKELADKLKMQEKGASYTKK